MSNTGAVPADLAVRTVLEGLEAVPDPESELAAMMHARIISGPSSLRALGRNEEADEHQRSAQELAARHGYKAVELRLLGQAVGSAMNALDVERVPELERRLEALERELGHPSGVGAAWPLILGEVAEARRRAQRYLEEARRARNTLQVTLLTRVPATAHYMLGEFAQIPPLLGLAERTESSEPDEYKEMARAMVAEALGDIEEARAGAQAGIAASSRLRLPLSVVLETAILAGIERRFGDPQRAQELYQQALRLWAGLTVQPPPISQLFTHARFGLEAVARGDAEVMARCREGLEPYEGLIVVPGNMPDVIVVGRALGSIAAAQGKWEEAIGYLERAEAFCKEKGLVVELAHCRLALSDALLRRKPATGQAIQPAHPEPVEGRAARGSTGSPRAEERQRAIALLDQAQAEYQRLGMPLYVQDCLARRELLRA